MSIPILEQIDFLDAPLFVPPTGNPYGSSKQYGLKNLEDTQTACTRHYRQLNDLITQYHGVPVSFCEDYTAIKCQNKKASTLLEGLSCRLIGLYTYAICIGEGFHAKVLSAVK